MEKNEQYSSRSINFNENSNFPYEYYSDMNVDDLSMVFGYKEWIIKLNILINIQPHSLIVF